MRDQENRENNIFEFSVKKDRMQEVLDELELNKITPEYLDECKRVAELYKKGNE